MKTFTGRFRIIICFLSRQSSHSVYQMLVLLHFLHSRVFFALSLCFGAMGSGFSFTQDYVDHVYHEYGQDFENGRPNQEFNFLVKKKSSIDRSSTHGLRPVRNASVPECTTACSNHDAIKRQKLRTIHIPTGVMFSVQDIKGTVECKGVHFSYTRQPSGSTVLAGLDFKVGAGKTLALMAGEPDCGKNIINALLERFYDLDEGIIVSSYLLLLQLS